MQRCRHGFSSYPIYTTLITGANVPYRKSYLTKLPEYVIDFLKNNMPPETPPGTLKQKITQTLFRDSDAQTDPYEPEVLQPVDQSLEILTLGWLSWNHGLPAGMREVVTIERARQKRAWETSMPVPVDGASRAIRDMILNAIEVNEWAFREVEMAAVGSLRMELARQCMRERLSDDRDKYRDRLSRLISAKEKEAAASLEKVKCRLRRSFRKLECERNGVQRKYKKSDVLFGLGDRTSEFYGPMDRFGWSGSCSSEVIPPRFRFWNVFSNMDIVLLDRGTVFDGAFESKIKPKPPEKRRELCVRETRWTLAGLQSMYENMKLIRLSKWKGKGTCRLKVRVPKPKKEFDFPFVVGPPEEEEEALSSCLFMQKTIKGRAVQTVMFEGRVRCQELLDELRSTHALQSIANDDAQMTALPRIFQIQREEDVRAVQEKKKQEILRALEGKTVSDVLDFLSKELLRLQDERITHALALLADRERQRREAEEAGRRQAEEQRRKEHEEMYKEISKVVQNSVDIMYAECVDFSTKYFVSKKAREEAETLARKIDLAAREAHLRSNELEQEEIISDLVHNFALPEVEKEIVRNRLKMRQRATLSSCHDAIYSEIENAMKGPRSFLGYLKSLPNPVRRISKVPMKRVVWDVGRMWYIPFHQNLAV